MDVFFFFVFFPFSLFPMSFFVSLFASRYSQNQVDDEEREELCVL
jgi:NADH:ubiquinone oxidoreductase subunit 4 (subunit M)